MPSDLFLRHFQPDEILISSQDASRILRFFFGTDVPPANELTPQDVAFAQALFLEAIDKSYAMGYVHIVFDCFYMKPPGSFESLKKMAEEFVKKAARHWFDHATGKDLSDPQIYDSVAAMIRANFRSVWEIRVQTGDLTY